MATKLGSTDVSFRLGASTPSKVALGAVEVWTDVVPTVPGIPTGLTVNTSETAESSVDVSWTAPESDGDSPITGYKVYRSFDGSTYTLHSSPSGTSAAVTVAYNGGQTVYVRVSAVNAIGEGDESEVTTGTMSDSAPGVPEGVSMAVTQGVRQVTLLWSPPLVDGGEAITGYVIYYRKGADSTLYTETVGPEVNDYTFDGSEESVGFEYRATVAATNSIGTGPASAQVIAATIDPPDAPSWQGASASSSNAGAVTAGWLSETGADFYELQYDTTDSFSDPQSPYSGSDTESEITGLNGGASYYLRVRASNDAGASEWSVWVSNPVTASATVPGVPTFFAVTPNYSSTQWDATWTEPSDGGSNITGYEIEEVDQDYSDLNTASLSGAGSSVSWGVNDADQQRNFRIRAVNSVGNGEWSEYINSIYNTPTVPGAPTIDSAAWDGYSTTVVYTQGTGEVTSNTFYFNNTPVSPDSPGAGSATWYSNYAGQDVYMTASNGLGEGPASNTVTVADNS